MQVNSVSHIQVGVVTVVIGSAADEAPAHDCGGCLVTNDVSEDYQTGE